MTFSTFCNIYYIICLAFIDLTQGTITSKSYQIPEFVSHYLGTMPKWIRPETVPVPTVWYTFEGKIIRNGVKNTYWVQDITDEYKDEILKYMLEEFTYDEPFCKYSNISQDPDVLNAFKNFWTESFKQNLGLVCLTKDQEGVIHIAGMNCTLLGTKDDEEDVELKLNEKARRVFQTLKYIKDQTDPFKMFNITEYLDGMGLYVLPKYRGEGLGLAILKAREPMCKALGLKTSLTLFTSKISQHLAERVGFEDLYTIDYEELERNPGLMTFPGIQEHTKSVRFMYIIYK